MGVGTGFIMSRKRNHGDSGELSIPPRWLHCPRKGAMILGETCVFVTITAQSESDRSERLVVWNSLV